MLYFRHVIVQVESRRMFLPMQRQKFSKPGPHDPLHPSVRSLLSFLHSLFKKGLSYSALNTGRSAVSNIGINVGDDQDHTPVGKHFLVCRYLKGVFNKIKPLPTYNNIWSVDTVLDYLSCFGPLMRSI
ncbi:hypothetical protein P5673_016092 [Acropora cervicornis]|uniref:Uncharacterized protein n=1 Tax=Acropora cervicornis TaxID=6130 RepID=A0AAD9QGN3_ACRCE|nr:hypothetical protein P5673_016092 [Acropora cervicornis]